MLFSARLLHRSGGTKNTQKKKHLRNIPLIFSQYLFSLEFSFEFKSVLSLIVLILDEMFGKFIPFKTNMPLFGRCWKGKLDVRDLRS